MDIGWKTQMADSDNSNHYTITPGDLSGDISLTLPTTPVSLALTSDIPSFSSDNFDDNSGTISIKNNGIALNEIVTVDSMKLLGNLSGSTENVTDISFKSK